MIRICASVMCLALTAATPAAAHHGWSEYDGTRPLELSGVIEASGYEHPHGHVRLKAADAVWTVVLAPPSRMDRRGLPAAALMPGNRATVAGYPSRSNAGEMRAERITIDNKTIELR